MSTKLEIRKCTSLIWVALHLPVFSYNNLTNRDIHLTNRNINPVFRVTQNSGEARGTGPANFHYQEPDPGAV